MWLYACDSHPTTLTSARAQHCRASGAQEVAPVCTASLDLSTCTAMWPGDSHPTLTSAHAQHCRASGAQEAPSSCAGCANTSPLPPPPPHPACRPTSSQRTSGSSCEWAWCFEHTGRHALTQCTRSTLGLVHQVLHRHRSTHIGP